MNNQVASTCVELDSARREKKLDQKALEYELAKLTAEVVNDYKPRHSKFENESNLAWLKKCYGVLEAHANPISFKILQVINEHKGLK